MASPALCTVTGTVESAQDNDALEGIKVEWSHSGFVFEDRTIMPEKRSVETNAAGLWTIDIARTATIGQSLYTVKFFRSGSEAAAELTFTGIKVPDTASTTWDLIAPEPDVAVDTVPDSTFAATLEQSIDMPQNVDFEYQWEFQDELGAAVSVAGAVFTLKVRSKRDAAQEILSATGGVFTISGGSSELLTLNLTEAAIADVVEAGTYTLESDIAINGVQRHARGPWIPTPTDSR